MKKHDYKDVNKQQPETLLEAMLSGAAFLVIIVAVSACIYIIGDM